MINNFPFSRDEQTDNAFVLNNFNQLSNTSLEKPKGLTVEKFREMMTTVNKTANGSFIGDNSKENPEFTFQRNAIGNYTSSERNVTPRYTNDSELNAFKSYWTGTSGEASGTLEFFNKNFLELVPVVGGPVIADLRGYQGPAKPDSIDKTIFEDSSQVEITDVPKASKNLKVSEEAFKLITDAADFSENEKASEFQFTQLPRFNCITEAEELTCKQESTSTGANLNYEFRNIEGKLENETTKCNDLLLGKHDQFLQLQRLKNEYSKLQNRFIGVLTMNKELERRIRMINICRSNITNHYKDLSLKFDEIEKKSLLLQKEKTVKRALIHELKTCSINMKKLKKGKIKLTENEKSSKLKSWDSKYREFADRCCTRERTIQRGEVNLQRLFYELRNYSKKFNPAKIWNDDFFPHTSAHSHTRESLRTLNGLISGRDLLSEDSNIIPPPSSGVCRSAC